jgi:hypothetical protein
VLVILTSAAERVVRRISLKHQRQLKSAAPALIEALSATVRAAGFTGSDGLPTLDLPEALD